MEVVFMASKRNTYKQFELYVTLGLILDVILFIGYMISAGNGIIWLKVILAILTFFVSGLCIYILFASQELLRPRSMWMTVGAVAISLCLLASLLLNYPSPKPTVPQQDTTETTGAPTETT